MLHNQQKEINLADYGYSDRYTINEQGQIYNHKIQRYITINKRHQYCLRDKDNNVKLVSLKPLYRQIYNKEYCIDNIKNLPAEEWKEIDKYYYISNYGRLKSYCGYNAIIVQQHYDNKYYLQGKIHGKKVAIHRLVAEYFVYNDNPIEKIEVHHIDTEQRNNKYNNLVWLTVEEHRNIHKELRKKCSTT